MAPYTCRDCGTSFTLPQHLRDRYPGWMPRQCRACRARGPEGGTGGAPRPRRSRSSREVMTTTEVLRDFSGGPDTGVFTDGGAVPNPGPGGWGAVYVAAGEILAEASGQDPATTNNRMELMALIEGVGLVPPGVAATVYTDSRLVSQTINEWAAGWEARGWRRRQGRVENLDLVKSAYYTFRRRPELELRWIASHSGYRWNEYADALASRWRLGGS